MPPKKKDEDIDPALLPSWQSVVVRMNFECSKDNADKVADLIHQSNFEIKKIISRAELIAYGKEKMMYVDPTQLTDKQKKDKNIAEVPTELTPELLAKIYMTFFNETVLNSRKVIVTFSN
jgi:hypothetical protein